MNTNWCKPGCWKIVLLVLVGIAALGWVVMALWNWLVPSLFVGGQEIGYLQAIGLLVLSKILFGGFRGHGHCGWHGRWYRRHWEHMTPGECEKFKHGMNGCCGGKHGHEESAPKE
jgi:hypothetical protein